MLVTMHTQRFGFISLLLLASIATSAEAAADEPANEAEARGLAQAFEKAVMSSDAAAVRAAFDIAALNRRALGKPADPDAAPARRDTALASGASAAISDFVGVGRPEIEQGASFGLLHLYHDGDEQRALFRLIYPNGGVGYLDCICVRHAEGKLRIDDAYSFEAGEMLSENLRRKLWLASEKNAPPPAPAAEGSISDGTMLATALREIKTRINGAEYQGRWTSATACPNACRRTRPCWACGCKPPAA